MPPTRPKDKAPTAASSAESVIDKIILKDKMCPALHLRKTEEFENWIRALRDRTTRLRIHDRLLRMESGNLGDAKAVGEGVMEIRFHFGPGYRVYFTRQGDTLVILLMGGDKSSQDRDIQKAIDLKNGL